MNGFIWSVPWINLPTSINGRIVWGWHVDPRIEKAKTLHACRNSARHIEEPAASKPQHHARYGPKMSKVLLAPQKNVFQHLQRPPWSLEVTSYRD